MVEEGLDGGIGVSGCCCCCCCCGRRGLLGIRRCWSGWVGGYGLRLVALPGLLHQLCKRLLLSVLRRLLCGLSYQCSIRRRGWYRPGGSDRGALCESAVVCSVLWREEQGMWALRAGEKIAGRV